MSDWYGTSRWLTSWRNSSSMNSGRRGEKRQGPAGEDGQSASDTITVRSDSALEFVPQLSCCIDRTTTREIASTEKLRLAMTHRQPGIK
jgi:hypothetical protein